MLPTTRQTRKKKRKRNEEEEQQSYTVLIYFDIEAQQDTGNHLAHLVCAETDRNNVQFTFKGKDYIQEFLQWVHNIANQPDVEKVIVVAHNFN